MATFTYPANPADGDIIIQGDKLAKYNKSTNTWTVGQLNPVAGIPGPTGPRGAKGDKGDTGSGLEIKGVVPNRPSLPATATDGDVWVTTDDGHGYVYDNGTWKDLGVVIQGPRGLDGVKGDKGDKGDTGERGPAGTQGLPGIQGPEGPVGTVTVASATNLGGIKIGRGLSIDASGTASAGVTEVDIETSPIPPNYSLTFQPLYFSLGQSKEHFSDEGVGVDDFVTDSINFKLPARANGALLFWFHSSQLFVNPSFVGVVGTIYPFRAYLDHFLTLTNATFENGNQTVGTATTHNLTIAYDPYLFANRWSNNARTKIDAFTCQPGADVTIDYKVNIVRVGKAKLVGGLSRLIIFPYADSASDANAKANTNDPLALLKAVAHSVVVDPDEVPIPPMTPAEQRQSDALDLKSAINNAVAEVDRQLILYPSGAVNNTLLQCRADLIAMRNLPGAASALWSELDRINAQINAIADYSFRFETP